MRTLRFCRAFLATAAFVASIGICVQVYAQESGPVSPQVSTPTGQNAAVPANPTSVQDKTPQDVAAQDSAPQLIDRVVAIVNGDVILQSDVEEEVRFAAFQPFSDASTDPPMTAALARLIDRALILQQMRNQPAPPQVTDQQLDKELTQVRLDIPSCARYNCRSDSGWQEFCATQGFTPDEVRARRRSRMELLAFIEQRFRTGIRISQSEIEQYYNTQFVPKFKERHLNPPALASVSDRIQEILLQQRVTTLLSQWLDTLRDQGTVQILDPTMVSKSETPATNSDTGDGGVGK